MLIVPLRLFDETRKLIKMFSLSVPTKKLNERSTKSFFFTSSVHHNFTSKTFYCKLAKKKKRAKRRENVNCDARVGLCGAMIKISSHGRSRFEKIKSDFFSSLFLILVWTFKVIEPVFFFLLFSPEASQRFLLENHFQSYGKVFLL